LYRLVEEPMSATRTREVWSHEDKERGLAALVIAGSSQKASELTGISDSTLRSWRTANPERYEKLRTELHGKVAEQIASDAEEMAQRLYRIEVKMADKLEAEIDTLNAKDLSGAFRNVSTSKALQIDKVSSPLRERPSHVQQSRDLAYDGERRAKRASSAVRVAALPPTIPTHGTALAHTQSQVVPAMCADANAHRPMSWHELERACALA
jgi:transposase-like protein